MPFRNLHQMKLYNKQCPTAITHGHAHILAVPMKPCIAATLPDICARIQAENRITATNVTTQLHSNQILSDTSVYIRVKNHIIATSATLQPSGNCAWQNIKKECINPHHNQVNLKWKQIYEKNISHIITQFTAVWHAAR